MLKIKKGLRTGMENIFKDNIQTVQNLRVQNREQNEKSKSGLDTLIDYDKLVIVGPVNPEFNSGRRLLVLCL